MSRSFTPALSPSTQILAIAARPAGKARTVQNMNAVCERLAQVPDKSNSDACLSALTEAIKDLDCAKDHKCGIRWLESTDQVSGSRVLVRDATNQDSAGRAAAKIDHGEKYAMQLLNQVRGAILLLDKDPKINEDEKKKAKRELMSLASNLPNDASISNMRKDIKDYNYAMIKILDAAGVKDSVKKMAFAKEMGNFHDEHMHTVTKTTAKSSNASINILYEAAEKLDPLSKEQKAEYNAIARINPAQLTALNEAQAAYDKVKSGRFRKLFGIPKNEKEALKQLDAAKRLLHKAGVPGWFTSLAPYKRDLIAAHSSTIASGQMVLPTQLIGDLTGLRNAHRKVTAVGNGLGTLKVLGESIHCGTPASSHGTVPQTITDRNVARLQEIGGTSIVLVNLMSKTREGNLFDRLAKTSATNVATPINMYRNMANRGGENTAALSRVVGNLGDAIRIDHPAIGAFLKSKKPGLLSRRDSKTEYEQQRKSAEDAMAKLGKHNPQYQALKAAVDAKNVLDRNKVEGNDNRNIFLNARTQVVINALRLPDGALNSYQAEVRAPVFARFCKSGKDRTGYEEANSTNDLLCSHLGIGHDTTEGKLLFAAQVDGGHTQQMASSPGGTRGCHGIKFNPEFGMASLDKDYAQSLDQKSSHFNKGVKVRESPAGKDIYERAKLSAETRSPVKKPTVGKGTVKEMHPDMTPTTKARTQVNGLEQ